jgi:tRNA A37 threonylcarbamoyladenosine synthetase subunit TsaC/SUA5/YrdC
MPNCLSIDPQSPDPKTLDKAVQVIESGGVVAFPTETFYGLAVDPENVASVQKLFKLKGRNLDKAIPLIAADVAQVESRIASLSVDELRLANCFWPGPYALEHAQRQYPHEDSMPNSLMHELPEQEVQARNNWPDGVHPPTMMQSWIPPERHLPL